MAYFPKTALNLLTPRLSAVAVKEKVIPRYACLRARLGLAVVGRTDPVSEDIRRALSVLAELDEREVANADQRI